MNTTLLHKLFSYIQIEHIITVVLMDKNGIKLFVLYIFDIASADCDTRAALLFDVENEVVTSFSSLFSILTTNIYCSCCIYCAIWLCCFIFVVIFLPTSHVSQLMKVDILSCEHLTFSGQLMKLDLHFLLAFSNLFPQAMH